MDDAAVLASKYVETLIAADYDIANIKKLREK